MRMIARFFGIRLVNWLNDISNACYPTTLNEHCLQACIATTGNACNFLLLSAGILPWYQTHITCQVIKTLEAIDVYSDAG